VFSKVFWGCETVDYWFHRAGFVGTRLVTAFVLLLAASGAARAATLNVGITNLSDGDSRDTSTGVNPNGVHDFRTNTSVIGSTATSFDTRYTAGMYGEAQSGIVAALDLSKNLGFRLTIDVMADQPSEAWEITLNASANGGLAEKADSNPACCDTGTPREGWLFVSDLIFSSSGAAETFSDISNPGTGVNWHPLGDANDGGAAADDFSSGLNSAVYAGTGNAQLILDFAWAVSLHSDSSTLQDGNEVGYMFGEDDNDLNGIMTGSFGPGYNSNEDGIWDRTQSGDGYFVSGEIAPLLVPEPGTVFLLGLGLLGLSIHRRRTSRD
jgi:hypothetical protein